MFEYIIIWRCLRLNKYTMKPVGDFFTIFSKNTWPLFWAYSFLLSPFLYGTKLSILSAPPKLNYINQIFEAVMRLLQVLEAPLSHFSFKTENL